MSALHDALSGLALRQRAIADNIANIETPGFHAARSTSRTRLRSAVADGSSTRPAVRARDRAARSSRPAERQQRQPRRARRWPRRDQPALPARRSARSTASSRRCAPRSADQLMTHFDTHRHRRHRPRPCTASGSTPSRDNIANINTVRRTDENAFQAQIRRRPGGRHGTTAASHVAGIELGDARGPDGLRAGPPAGRRQRLRARAPTSTSASQMSQLIMAQRGFQANVAVVKQRPGHLPARPRRSGRC